MELYLAYVAKEFNLANPNTSLAEINEEIEFQTETMTEYADLFLCLAYIY